MAKHPIINVRNTASTSKPKERRKFASDYMSIISVVVSSLIAIGIFLLSDKISEKNSSLQKAQNTVVWANDLFYRIDNAIGEKIKIERQKGLHECLTFDCINTHKEVETRVFIILNQYSALGYAASRDLVEISRVSDIRGNAIKVAWEDYHDYITEFRNKQHSPNAWEDFENLYNAVLRVPK